MEPGLVMQFLAFQVPLLHAQLLISTVILGFLRWVPSSPTWPPNSEADVASKPTLGTLPGMEPGILSYTVADESREPHDPDDVAPAVSELQAAGHSVLREAHLEPWGQTTSQLLSPEGLLVGVTYTPWMHESD